MDWNFSWILFGGGAFLLAIINLGRSCKGKYKGWQELMFASLSCGVLAVLTEYRMVNTWLSHGDMPAVMDVVPGMSGILTAAACLGIVLNLLVLVINSKRR